MKFRIVLRLLLSIAIIAASLKTAQAFWEKRVDTKEVFQKEIEVFHQNEEKKEKLKELVEERKQLEGQVEEVKKEATEAAGHKKELEQKIEKDKEPLEFLDSYKEEFAQYQEDLDALNLYNTSFFEGKYDQKGIDEVAKVNKIMNVGMEIGKYLPGMELLSGLIGNSIQSNNAAYYEYMEKLNDYTTANMQEPLVELAQNIHKLQGMLEFYQGFVHEDNSLTEQYRNVKLLKSAGDRIWKLNKISNKRNKVAKSANKAIALLEETREIYRYVLDEDGNSEYFDTLDEMIYNNQSLANQMTYNQDAVLSKEERYDLLKGYIEIYCDTIDAACASAETAGIAGMNRSQTDVPSTGFSKWDGFRMYRYFNIDKNDALTYLAGSYHGRGDEIKFAIYYYMNGKPARAHFEYAGDLYFDIYGNELSGNMDQDTVDTIYEHLEWFTDNYYSSDAGKQARDCFATYIWGPQY